METPLWSLVLVGMTRCAHNSGATCATWMKLASRAEHQRRRERRRRLHAADDPILGATEPNDATRPVVKDGGDVKIDVTVSETMASLTQIWCWRREGAQSAPSTSPATRKP